MSEEGGDSRDLEEPTEDFETRMLTISDAYELGVNLTYLKHAGTHNSSIGSVETGGVLHSLDTVQHLLLATNTSDTVASQIERTKNLIQSEYADDDARTQIGENLGDHLNRQASTWTQLLREELVNETRINIPNAGILDYEQLMHHPEVLFESGIWEELDDESRNDMQEAAQAFPVGCTTASVMVSLRAVERYLRKWYEYESGETLERGTWGSVLDDLFDIYVSDEDADGSMLQKLSGTPSVLSNIYYLKDKRDKVTHSDDSPTAYEAIVTLFMVSGTITEVCKEINDL